MQVSVVIPTFNRAALLSRAIDSVLAQTRPADQIIVVDDGSTDATAEVLERYGSAIEVIQQPNRGVSSARNRGIEAAAFPWIALLDSDDCWHPQKLRRQIDFHCKNRDLRWSHTEEIWIRNGRHIAQKKHHAKVEGEAFYASLPFCKIAPSTVLIAKTLFEEAGYFDEALPVCEDYDLWLRVLRRYPVGLLHERLTTKYAGHPQLSFSHYILDRYRVEALCKHLPDPLVEAEIAKKIAILQKGAQKYKNVAIARFCERVAEHALGRYTLGKV